jgi:hypothetical protein
MDDLKAKIANGNTEIERRAYVQAAIAYSRIDGGAEPSSMEQKIYDEYIRGGIEAKDLMEVYLQRIKGSCY